MKRGIIFGAYVYDLMHEGHLNSLIEAKLYCDHLTVCLRVDPITERPDRKQVPTERLWVRHQRLLETRGVDQVICYQTEEDIINILRTIPFDVRFSGAVFNIISATWR